MTGDVKVQRDVLSSLIAELEAADSEILAAHTPISDLNPEQFRRLCAEAMSSAMKPIVVAAAEAANKVVQNGQFEDEAKSLTGVRRSRSVVVLADEEDKGN